MNPNCTTSATTYIEYKLAYEYVISDNSTSFFLFSVVECSNEEIALYPPFQGYSLARKDLGLLAVLADLVYMALFLLSLWLITYLIHVDSERHRNLLFETREFSAVVNNLPKLSQDFTVEQMKAELWDHVQRIIKEQPQQIERLSNSDESRACEIIDIRFAMSDYQYLEDVVAIKKISQVIERLDMQIGEAEQSPPKMERLQEKRNIYLAQIDSLKTRYIENTAKLNVNNQALSAFVLFRSMEGVERAKSGFRSHGLSRCWFRVFHCCRDEKRRAKLFHGKHLVVEEAVEPELLLWENFGVSTSSRFFRLLFYILFVFTMLIVCVYVISYLETASNEAESELAGVQCRDGIDALAANLDAGVSSGKRSGDLHCFCKNLLG